MWDELSGGIVNLLSTLSTIDGTHIFDYGATNIDGYPAITVTPYDNTAEFADTSRNKRSYVFAVRCYQERVKAGEDESEATMRRLVDSVITLFDQNMLLDDVNGYGRLNGRGYCRAMPSVWKYVSMEQVDARMAEILLECVVIQ